MGKPNMAKAIMRAWDKRWKGKDLHGWEKFRDVIHAMTAKESGEAFQQLRISRGISEEEIARKLGFKPETIRNWESGQRKTGIHFINFFALLDSKSKRKPKTRRK